MNAFCIRIYQSSSIRTLLKSWKWIPTNTPDSAPLTECFICSSISYQSPAHRSKSNTSRDFFTFDTLFFGLASLTAVMNLNLMNCIEAFTGSLFHCVWGNVSKVIVLRLAWWYIYNMLCKWTLNTDSQSPRGSQNVLGGSFTLLSFWFKEFESSVQWMASKAPAFNLDWLTAVTAPVLCNGICIFSPFALVGFFNLVFPGCSTFHEDPLLCRLWYKRHVWVEQSGCHVL